MSFLQEMEHVQEPGDPDLQTQNDQKEFDEIAHLARLICLSPICLIVLTGKDSPKLLAAQGLPEGESALNYNLSPYLMQGPAGVSLVADLRLNESLKNNPYVSGPPYLRFWAGVPLISKENKLIGTLSLLDTKPNDLTEHQKKALLILGSRAADRLEILHKPQIRHQHIGYNYESLQMILTQSPHYIFTLDKNLHITYINRTDRFRKEDIVGRSMMDFLYEEFQLPFKSACQRVFEEGEIVSDDYRVLGVDQQERWYRFNICPLRDQQPEVKQLLIISQDFTYEHRHELEIRTKDDRYRDIVENTSDMIMTVDNDARITLVNRSWLHTMGFDSPDEVLGTDLYQFIHEDNRVAATRIFEMMKAGHPNMHVEVNWVTRSGESILTSANIDCGYINGKVAFQRGIFRNITEERKREVEMQKNQLMLNEAQKISKTGNVEVNFETGEVKWSEEMYNIMEIDKESPELFLSSLYEMIDPADQEKAVRYIEQTQTNLTPSRLEFRLATPRGTIKNINCNASPFLNRDGKVGIILLTLQDISDIRQFEKKVFTAAVESEERERTRMAGELHDGVCQYLASASLMLDVLNEKLKSLPETCSDEQVAQLLDLSRTSIRDGLDLVRKVSHDLFPMEFYNSGLIQSVRELVYTLNMTEDIRFVLDISGEYTDSDPSVSINIFRIIQEFTRNSQKYSGASEVVIRIENLPGFTQVYLSDNGRGFDMDKIGENQKGIGLLSMKKRIESIGGNFQYKSSPGQGVQLTMSVPLVN